MKRGGTVLVWFLVCIPLGGVGAWAFNPDRGAVVHSLVLWRIFGIMFEGGLFVLLGGACLLLAVAALLALLSLVRDVGRGDQSHAA
jgi:hypothetical protein